MGKVKWDSAADQTLLAKILETHDLSVDAARVAEAWPTQDNDHKPTPRAIKERLSRIRENVRLGSAAGSGPSSPVTPKKRTPRKKANENSASASPSRKRKRVTKAAAADDEEEGNSKEEEDLPEDNDEPLAESAIEKETGPDAPNPSLHPQVEDEFPNADTGKNDPEWTEDKDEDAGSDTDQLSK
ncbi:hypothetical protein N7536_000986 [Penicillium majusculum]|uniref:Uncharacterized protein n=1 Tax=Penicillium solitum TaxID=60172 RepID=A0A1V6R6D9_9EURO|nr:uncharacterized protein PENSOL_c013G08711 [Penicillium solitum]KAJ5705297.1 hypothetical protein N7536_000986 [Penicillium majusculum]OQD97104.1 hypothetical protein PENSOL_c013G08711 [Penicillium solitum]